MRTSRGSGPGRRKGWCAIRRLPSCRISTGLPFRDFHSPDKTFIDGRRVVRGVDPYAGQSIYLLMSSRGCPFPSCTFCSNSVTDRLYPGQKFYRLMSVDRMLEEVAYAKKHFPNLKRIRFDDEEFPVTKKWFDEFCERWPREAGLPFEIHMDPRVVSGERLERLRAVGLDMAFMGIQSTARINRELYCRNVSDDEVLAAAADAPPKRHPGRLPGDPRRSRLHRRRQTPPLRADPQARPALRDDPFLPYHLSRLRP